MIQIITGFFNSPYIPPSPAEEEEQNENAKPIDLTPSMLQDCRAFLLAEQVQDYYDLLFKNYQNSPAFTCPVCGTPLYLHGTVQRSIILPSGKFWINISRVRCPHCRKCHRVLPDIFVPYHQICSLDANTVTAAVSSNPEKPSLSPDMIQSDMEMSTIYRLARLILALVRPLLDIRPFHFFLEFFNFLPERYDGFPFHKTRVFLPTSHSSHPRPGALFK